MFKNLFYHNDKDFILGNLRVFVKPKRLFVFFLVIFLLSIFSLIYPTLTGETISSRYAKEDAILLRVIDGDTIETNLGKVRLLGINTPEKNMPYSNESKNLLRQFENQSIELLRDLEDKDMYGRMLRYLFYETRLINIEILERGFASAYMTFGLRYEEELLRAESYSRKYSLGIWEKSQDACTACISLVELNATAEFFIIKNSCNFVCNLQGWFVKDTGRNLFWLRLIASGEQQTFNSSKSVWNNDGDSFFMFDNKGKLVIFSRYS